MSLESGEIPPIPFKNDGSFLEKFQKNISSAAAAALPPLPPAPEASNAEPAVDRAKTAGSSVPSTDGAPQFSGPPAQPSNSSKPAVLLKAKQSIVQVRPRGGVAKAKNTARKKTEGQQATSFYLQEMERYKQLSCDGKDGARPMVK